MLNIFRIINSRKRKFNIIHLNQFDKIEKIVMPIVSQLSFQSVSTIFCIYATINYNASRQFIQVLRYDLFRKVERCAEYFYIYDIVRRFKGRKMVFRVNQPKGVGHKVLQIPAFDLLCKMVEVVTKMLDRLRAEEVVNLVDCYYENQINQRSLLQVLSTQIIKRGSDYTIQTLGKCFFKLTLLGHRSKIATKYVLQQYHVRYHSTFKKYREEEVFLLPSEGESEEVGNLNFKQIYLQECLLMTLWSIARQFGKELDKNIEMMKMFQLIPVKVESGDPLAIQLALNINKNGRKV